MDFRVELSARAQSDIAAIYEWLQAQSAGEAGERWFVALRAAIASLKDLPLRCPPAPESQESPTEVRQLLYGRRPNVYRILFAVEGNIVQVLHIRHGRRRPAALR
jgi:plasmid stabilization system protein ParE